MRTTVQEQGCGSGSDPSRVRAHSPMAARLSRMQDTVGLEGHEVSQAGPRLKLLPPPLQRRGHRHCLADDSSGERYLTRRIRSRDTYSGKMMSREVLLKLKLLPARSVSPHKRRPRLSKGLLPQPRECSLFSGSLSHIPVLLPRTVLLTSHILTLNGGWFLSRDQICNQIPGPALGPCSLPPAVLN